MKFFVKVFLLVLNLISFIEIVLSIKCHKTDSDFDRRQCWDELDLSRSDGSEDKAISNFFVCQRRNAFKEETDRDCPRKDTTSCYTIIYELKDQTQLMIRHCNNTDDMTERCPHDKETFDRMFTFGRFIKSSRCDYCSSDNCNDQKPRDKPSLSALSPGVVGIKCHYSSSDCMNTESVSKVIDCMRNTAKEDKFGQCPPFSTACANISIKCKYRYEGGSLIIVPNIEAIEMVDNGEKLMIKDCIGPKTPNCEQLSEMLGRELNANVECDSCETNFCNGGTPSGEMQEKHSGRSHSLAASSLHIIIAFGILFFNLLVHFLL